MEFKNPGLTADIIVERENKILLIKRKHPPCQGYWALPGGFLEYGKETIEETGKRELYEETGLVVELKDLELLGIASEPKRDPRGHIVSPYFFAKKTNGELKAGDDAENAKWFYLDNLPPLAFDHAETIEKYKIWRIKNGRG